MIKSILFSLAASLTLVCNTQAREMDGYDYRILAQETNGQCASPGAQYGCKYDSNVTIPAE